MRRATGAIGTVSAVLVWAEHLGAWHRAFDSIAMLAPVFALLCILAVFVSGWRMRVIFLLCAASVIVPLIRQFQPQAPGGDLRIYVKNMWVANADVPRLAQDIRAAGVDVVFLQEVSRRNNDVLTLLQADFPHQHHCVFDGWTGVAVLSRHAFVSTGLCSDVRGAAAVQAEVNGTSVWLASVHIPWPWPAPSQANEQAVVELLGRLDGKVVVAGDFNIFPWTGRVQRIARMTGTRLAGPVRTTYNLRGVPLPIDHVLAPGGGALTQVRPGLGSDHAGLIADIGL